MSNDKMMKVLGEARAAARLAEVREEMQEQIDEAEGARIAAIHQIRRAAERDVKHAVLHAENTVLKDTLAAMERALSAQPLQPHPTPQDAPSNAPAAVYALLRKVVDEFLDGYAKERKPAMFKKHQAALVLLKELFGAKPINQVKQADFMDYFEVVQRLPPRWAEKCKKRNVKARALATEDHEELLGKKTFDDNYVVPIRLFLKWALREWQDQGFPTTLIAEGIEFSGEDDEGKNKQRAVTHDELQRLFHCELLPFRDRTDQAHKWWLPALAFYTGARVNELAQLNPQIDIAVSPEGIDYLFITAKTAADERIRKSVKTGDERMVPLHPELIKDGFLDYVKTVRESGSKLLFPAWTPVNRRASTQAERWFRDLLRDTGLRDETPGARIVGFHAFRHTLLTRAADSEPAVDAGPITGHSDMTKGGAQRGYEGARGVSKKLKLLTGIQFGFKPAP